MYEENRRIGEDWQKAKGYGIVANILALLSDIRLGHRRIETGLELRHA